MKANCILATGFALLSLWTVHAVADTSVGSGFTYQGQLRRAEIPVNGLCDFEFSLWDDATNSEPSRRLGAQSLGQLSVTDGLFTAEPNTNSEFGPAALHDDLRVANPTVASVANPDGIVLSTARRRR